MQSSPVRMAEASLNRYLPRVKVAIRLSPITNRHEKYSTNASKVRGYAFDRGEILHSKQHVRGCSISEKSSSVG